MMDQIVSPPSAANSAEQSDFVTAFARGLEVIRALGAEGPSATLAEIARRVDLPRATVRRSLITLESLGYVKTEGKVFALTPQILSLGYSYLISSPLARASQPYLQSLSSTLNEPSATAILNGDEVVLLVRVPVEGPVNPGIPVGSCYPAYCTATGRVLMGNQPDYIIEDYLSRLKPRAITSQTTTDPQKIRSTIFEARKQGYSINEEETEIGVRVISVPIENTKRSVIGAINVTAPVNRISASEMTNRFLPVMRKKACEIGAALR